MEDDEEDDIVQYTCITQLLNEILDKVTLPPQLPTSSRRTDHYCAPCCSTPEYRLYHSHPQLSISPSKSYLCEVSKNVQTTSNSFMSENGFKVIPPSYSSVIRYGSSSTRNVYRESVSFIAPEPPPSYAELHGLYEEETSETSSESVVFGPDPVYIICPRCSAIVLTQTHSRRPRITYVISFLMCILLCWPCCVLPLCSPACSEVSHSCPNCNVTVGLYEPW